MESGVVVTGESVPLLLDGLKISKGMVTLLAL